MSASSESDKLPADFQANNRIAIIDFGSQVTQLIARSLRKIGVYAEVFVYDGNEYERVKNFSANGIIFSGGPQRLGSNASDSKKSGLPEEISFRFDDRLFELGLPILGICLGEQILCSRLGGKVVSSQDSEYGPAELEITDYCDLFDKKTDLSSSWRVGSSVPVWMSHTDKILSIPPGFKSVARTSRSSHAIITDPKRKIYGLQFHPEVSHTCDGERLLKNFVRRVCRCIGQWQAQNAIDKALEDIRSKVGEGRVLCALSGGVDSAVAGLLINRALGDHFYGAFIDNGLLREGESEMIEFTLRHYFGNNLQCFDESKRFISALLGVFDPEEKRKKIGEVFIQCFEEIAQNLQKSHGKIEFLGQGTLYPDVIESLSPLVGGVSQKIKSHHNVGGLPEVMSMNLVEPLRFLFKDEVRVIGRKLGLDANFISRHPFPGPGLAVRIPGEVTAEKCAILRRADKVFIESLRQEGLYEDIWQAFAILLPTKSVGVMGDVRSYGYCCLLRAVISDDGMTAQPYAFTPEFLAHVASEIVNEVEGVNRVLYDCSGKPPSTIEWE